MPADGNIRLNITSQHLDRRTDGLGGRELLRLVPDLGGTISGEHGIGLAKRPFSRWNSTSEVIDLQRRIGIC